MKKILIENLLPSIILLVIGAFLGMYVNSLQSESENEPRYLDYEARVNPGIISVENETVANDIQVFYKQRAIDNLTSIDIVVGNLSDRDFEEVPLFVDIKSGSDSLEIINMSVRGRNGVPGEVVNNGELIADTKMRRFWFNVKTANRGENNGGYFMTSEPVLVVSFLIVGYVNPEVNVHVNKPNLRSRVYDYKNYEPWDPFESTLGAIVLGLIGIFLYLLLIILLNRLLSKKIGEKRILKRRTALAEMLSPEFETLRTPKELLERLAEFEKLYAWNNTSPIFRRLFDLERPKQEKNESTSSPPEN